MIKVAVTGGIGSGKSVVCKIFEKIGIPVFNADSEAKKLMSTSSHIHDELISLFGSSIYQPNGDIHRKKMADLIFNDNFALQKVNEIIHPEVRKKFREWAEEQKSPYIIQEAAIIFESGQSDSFDRIITVTAPIELKIERVMKRDLVAREKVLDRMKKQLPDEEKIAKSDFIIVNNDIEMIIPQIIEIHKKLI
jgi:dephospho-CoA kinase